MASPSVPLDIPAAVTPPTLQKRICYFDNYIFTGVATVDMVLWEDTRIVPRDNQLWAIQ